MSNVRVCVKCGFEKPTSEFYRESNVCRECVRIRKHLYYMAHREEVLSKSQRYYVDNEERIKEYKKKWYRENPEKVLAHRAGQRENARLNEQKKRAQLFAIYNEVKTPCVKCGETRLYVIEFHHIDPGEKERTISQMRNMDKVREEVKKCVCLCANCHKEFHHIYGIRPADPVNALKEYLGKELNYA